MIWRSPDVLSRPYAMAVAVGSLTMRRTLRPAMMPASLVACLWLSCEGQQRSPFLKRKTYVEVGGHRHDGVRHLLAEVRLGNLLHLAQDHGRNLLGGELLVLAIDLDGDDGLALLGENLVGEVLDVGLHLLLVELAANQAPRRSVKSRWHERGEAHLMS